jgi:hypothetical protein
MNTIVKCKNGCGKDAINIFCSRSCNVSFNNKKLKGITFKQRYGETKALAIQSKMSKSIQKVANETKFTEIGGLACADKRRGKTMIEEYGETKANQIKDKIKDSLKEYRKTPEGKETLNRHSLKMIDLISSGREFGNAKRGIYKGIQYGSGLELDFLITFEKMFGNLNIVKRNSNPIPRFDNPLRFTIPDYRIEIDSKLIALIEVKNEGFIQRPKVYRKVLSLLKYSEKTNILCGIFTYKLRDLFYHANPEPRQLNSFLEICKSTLISELVNCKVQRLTIEDKESNKMVNSGTKDGVTANYALLNEKVI